MFSSNFNSSNNLADSTNASSVLTNMLTCTIGRHRPLSQEDMAYAAYRGSDPRNRLSTHSLDSAPIGPYGSNTQGGSRYATLPARTNKGWHAIHCNVATYNCRFLTNRSLKTNGAWLERFTVLSNFSSRSC